MFKVGMKGTLIHILLFKTSTESTSHAYMLDVSEIFIIFIFEFYKIHIIP